MQSGEDGGKQMYVADTAPVKQVPGSADSISVRVQNGQCLVPDCCAINVHPTITSVCTSDLYLDVSFGSKWIGSSFCECRLCFRGGRLRLLITGGIIPLVARGLVSSLLKETPIQNTIHSEHMVSKGHKRVNRGSFKLAEMQPEVEGQHESSTDYTQGRQFTTTETFETRFSEVIAEGLDNEPSWCFQTRHSSYFLKGSLVSEWLGELKIVRFPCNVNILFEVAPDDIWIGSETARVSRNKLMVIKLLFLKKSLPC